MPLGRTPIGQAAGLHDGNDPNRDRTHAQSVNHSETPSLSANALPFEMPRQPNQSAIGARPFESEREPPTDPQNAVQFDRPNERNQQPHGLPDEVNFDQSWRNVVREEIIKINPVQLETDELHYELGLRALSNAGHHRDRTACLGRAIVSERKNPNLYPRESH